MPNELWRHGFLSSQVMPHQKWKKKYSASAQFLLSASIGVIISRIDRWHLHNLQAGGALLFGAMLAPLLDQSHLVNKFVKLDVCEGFCKAVGNNFFGWNV